MALRLYPHMESNANFCFPCISPKQCVVSYRITGWMIKHSAKHSRNRTAQSTNAPAFPQSQNYPVREVARCSCRRA